MKLTTEEIQKIDDALEALKRSLKEELSALPEEQMDPEKLNDPFLKQISDSYLSAKGILCLLQDSGVVSARCGGPCYVTCVNPAKVACGTDTVK